MQRRKKLVFSIACALAIATTACNSETTDSEITTTEANPEATSTLEPPANNLKSLDEGYAISAQYPAELEANFLGSGEGAIAIFKPTVTTENSEDIELSVFLPRGSEEQSVEDYLANFVNADNGLIASNGWQIIEPETASFTAADYSWVDTIIDFETGSEVVGHIMIGKVNGQTVQAILRYPSEEADTYLPMMKTVLNSVTFDESQLPLPASQV